MSVKSNIHDLCKVTSCCYMGEGLVDLPCFVLKFAIPAVGDNIPPTVRAVVTWT